jgi:hypothetical protein
MPLPFDGDGSSESSHSSFAGLWFPTLSNATFSSLVTIDFISPLPSPITLEHGGPSCDFVFLILNPQVATPFDVAIPLFPSSI